MGKVLYRSGMTLLITGFVLIIICGFVTFYMIGQSMKEEKVLENDDFTEVGNRTYRARLDAEDIRSDVEVKVQTGMIFTDPAVEITVKDPGGTDVAHRQGDTPISVDFETDYSDSGSYQVFVRIIDDDVDLDDITISVTTSGLSNSGMWCCVGSMGLGLISVVMIAVGITLLIVSGVKKDKGNDDEVVHYRRDPTKKVRDAPGKVKDPPRGSGGY